MAALTGFDANDVPPPKDFEPIPNGSYIGAIVESEAKPTSSGNGSYLKLTFQILAEGPYKNRKLFENLNLDNPSDQAVGIARSQLGAICRAVGVLRPNDSSELHNRPLVLKVKVKRRNDTGEMTNGIAGYEAVDATPPAVPRPAPAAGPGAAPRPQPPAANGAARPVGGTPPWARQAAPAPQPASPPNRISPEQLADEAAKVF